MMLTGDFYYGSLVLYLRLSCMHLYLNSLMESIVFVETHQSCYSHKIWSWFIQACLWIWWIYGVINTKIFNFMDTDWGFVLFTLFDNYFVATISTFIEIYCILKNVYTKSSFREIHWNASIWKSPSNGQWIFTFFLYNLFNEYQRNLLWKKDTKISPHPSPPPPLFNPFSKYFTSN